MFEKQIQAGVAKLNDYFGNYNWKQEINLDRLYISSDRWCILGQLFPSFSFGMKCLFGDCYDIFNIAAQFGFCTNSMLDDSGMILTREWREYLEC